MNFKSTSTRIGPLALATVAALGFALANPAFAETKSDGEYSQPSTQTSIPSASTTPNTQTLWMARR